jgi:hypothetical protein
VKKKIFIMTNPNSDRNNQNRPDSLMDKYNIKKDAYYGRIKFLGIQVMRDSNRMVYLTNEQVELMDELHSHIEETGKMEGFVSSNKGTLTVREGSEMEEAAEQIELKNEEENSKPNEDQFAALVRSSAEFAAGMEIAKYTIAKQMQDNPDLLPSDLKEQVEAVKASCSPKSQSPTSIANQFLQAYKIA